MNTCADRTEVHESGPWMGASSGGEGGRGDWEENGRKGSETMDSKSALTSGWMSTPQWGSEMGMSLWYLVCLYYNNAFMEWEARYAVIFTACHKLFTQLRLPLCAAYLSNRYEILSM